MITSPNKLKWIEQTRINEKDCLRFSFQGILTQKQSSEACAEWIEICNLDNTKKYTIIFNALNMENYEPMARTNFQKTIKELSNQITKVWVVTGSRLISGGAAIMGMFTSFPIKSVSSEHEITT